MPVQVTCPHCNKASEVEPDQAGSRIACWHCERKFIIPTAVAPKPPDDAECYGEDPDETDRHTTPARTVGVWVGVAAAVAAIGVFAAFAVVTARRAAEAERFADLARSEKSAAEQVARDATRESLDARRDADTARQQAKVNEKAATREKIAAEVAKADAATARKEADEAKADLAKAEADLRLQPPPEPAPGRVPGGFGGPPPVIPKDVPGDVKEKATAALRKKWEEAEPAIRKVLDENRELIPRLRSGLVVKRVGVLVPKDAAKPVNFPSQASKDAEIKSCEERIAAAEVALKAWAKKDFDHFAPDLTAVTVRGAVGRIVGRQVRTVEVIDKRVVLVRVFIDDPAKVESPYKAEVMLTGVDGSKFSPGLVSEFNEVVAVAGSVEVGGRTYPQLAVFSASKP